MSGRFAKLEARLAALEAAQISRHRKIVFWTWDDTADEHDRAIADMIASGKARPDDMFIRWENATDEEQRAACPPGTHEAGLAELERWEAERSGVADVSHLSGEGGEHA